MRLAAFDAAGKRVGASTSASAQTLAAQASTNTFYTTDFPLVENPLAESGRWIEGAMRSASIWNERVDQQTRARDSETESGVRTARRPQTAILSGTWGRRVRRLRRRLFTSQSEQPDSSKRSSCGLRTSITPHSNTGYEINFAARSGGELPIRRIVRWDGPRLGAFTLLDSRGGIEVRDPYLADVVKATIVGNVITSYINGVACRCCRWSTTRSPPAAQASGFLPAERERM